MCRETSGVKRAAEKGRGGEMNELMIGRLSKDCVKFITEN